MSADVLIATPVERIFFRDSLNGAFRSWDIYKSSAMLGAFIFVLSIGLSFLKAGPFLNKLIYAGISGIVTSVFLFLVTLLTVIFCQIRLKPEQLQIKWEFSEENAKLMDSTGLAIITPWSQIKHVSFKKAGVCFYTKPRGSRWLPKRFLTPEQLQELTALVDKAVG